MFHRHLKILVELILFLEWPEFVEIVGLTEFDCDGEKARAVEDAIGIKVIRHS